MNSINLNFESPTLLRRKAEEFLRLAATARDPVAYTELKRLAELYLERARDLDAAVPHTA